MTKPIRTIISGYTVMSIIVTILFPILSHANEIDTNDNGSIIVFSGTENSSSSSENFSTENSTIENFLPTSTGEILPIIETGNIHEGSGNTETENIIPSIETGSIEISTGIINTISTDTTGGTNTGDIVTINDTITDNLLLDTANKYAITDVADDTTEISKFPESTPDKHPEIEILVQFKGSIESTIGEYQINQIEGSHNLKTTETIAENNIAVMTSTTPEMIASIVDGVTTSYEKSQQDTILDTVIDALKNDPRIAHVQKNFIYTTQSVDDTDYTKLWALNNEGQNINGLSGTIDADIDYPEAMQYSSGKLGSGIIVAILDTGIAYNHPDLMGHMWDGTNCLSETGASLGGCIHGYDFSNEDTDPNDGHSHGTHIAGTIGAMTNNTTGITGISPNISLMAVKILSDKGGGTSSDIIRGINFAKHNGARVINASFGGIDLIQSKSDFDALTYDAIKNFPGLFIAAAGNDGKNLETMPGYKNFPSGFGSDTIIPGDATIPGLTNVIAVGASDQNDTLTSFSNYGTGTVHIVAPGTNIYSSIPIFITNTGIVDEISYENSWIKLPTSSTGGWLSRSGVITNDGSINLSGALWGNSNVPYGTGETNSIEKIFSNVNGNIGSISLNIWCDTPSSATYKDYVEVLVNTGGIYKTIQKIDEDIISFNSQAKSLSIDGHIGHYVRYSIQNGSLGTFQNGTLGIRLNWKSDSIDDLENGLSNYGCAVENISISTVTETYGYGYKNGTSMATPHVAGAAALAWSYKSNATTQEVHDAIINGGDMKNSLISKIQSGNRLNINGMIQLLGTPISQPLPSCNISINPNSVTNGSGAVLTWNMTGSLTGTLNPGNVLLGSSGSMNIIPPSNTTTPYILVVTNSAGSSSCSASVTAVPAGTVVVPPVVTPPSSGGGGGGSMAGPGGGGGGSSPIVINTLPEESLPPSILPIKSSFVQKNIPKKISSEGRLLNMSIRVLQKKINSRSVESTSIRRENILSLQDLYRAQIQLMRAGEH